MPNEKIRFNESVIVVLKKEKLSQQQEGRSMIKNIIGILTNKDGEKRIIRTGNLMTTAGNIYYAQMGCGISPTNNFNTLVLGTGDTTPTEDDTYDSMTPIANSSKLVKSGYPKNDDDDEENTDRSPNTMTWTFQYTAADFTSAAIKEGCITIASPTTGSPLLARWLWTTAFAKDADTSLKVIVNYTVTGT